MGRALAYRRERVGGRMVQVGNFGKVMRDVAANTRRTIFASNTLEGVWCRAKRVRRCSCLAMGDVVGVGDSVFLGRCNLHEHA